MIRSGTKPLRSCLTPSLDGSCWKSATLDCKICCRQPEHEKLLSNRRKEWPVQLFQTQSTQLLGQRRLTKILRAAKEPSSSQSPSLILPRRSAATVEGRDTPPSLPHAQQRGRRARNVARRTTSLPSVGVQQSVAGTKQGSSTTKIAWTTTMHLQSLLPTLQRQRMTTSVQPISTLVTFAQTLLLTLGPPAMLWDTNSSRSCRRKGYK